MLLLLLRVPSQLGRVEKVIYQVIIVGFWCSMHSPNAINCRKRVCLTLVPVATFEPTSLSAEVLLVDFAGG